MPKKPLKVVYLFGSGASQGEASFADDTINLLADGIREDILTELGHEKNNKRLNATLINELTRENVDVEQLISLYASSGNKQNASLTRILKKYYKEGVLKKINELDKAGKFTPKLYAALIDMHQIEPLKETLLGVMTLNYEDLIDRAVWQVYEDVDYSFAIDCEPKSVTGAEKKPFIVLKLHGSFNWKNEFPVTLKNEIRHDEDILWIPPGVEKRYEQYPFSIVWGKARELLDCDILRIVGCSLSRNDWHLVSLLYSTQRLNKKGKGYGIEVINRALSREEETRPIYGEEDIKKKYPHLRHIRHIYELEEIIDLVQTSLMVDGDGASRQVDTDMIIDYLSKLNPFEMWLRAKGEYLKKKNIHINTSKNIFKNFIEDKVNEDTP